MKRYLWIVGLLMFQGVAYAGTISVPTFSADSGAPHLNTFRTTVVNVINGNIEGSGSTGSTLNVKADSLGELDMADEINPRIRANQLLGIGSDSVASGSLVQASFVYSGLVQATDTDLTADISAGTAYVNGYYVTKAATALTYTASKETYVDLSQTGTYTQSAVTIGAAAPAVAANSARISKVLTSSTAITTVTDLRNMRIPGLIVPAQYRSGLKVSRDSATTITVMPGSCEINNTMLSKTSATTLTLTTAGDWAGGSSLAAANTYGYVGEDASGNLKLHTTAPAYDNYGVSTTVGKLRYATWSSTVYRILGWFRMNASSQLDTATVGNIKEGDIANVIQSQDVTTVTTTSITATQLPGMSVLFYSSGGPVKVSYTGPFSSSADAEPVYTALSVDSGAIGPISNACTSSGAAATHPSDAPISYVDTYSQGTHNFDIKWYTTSGTATQSGIRFKRILRVEEL